MVIKDGRSHSLPSFVCSAASLAFSSFFYLSPSLLPLSVCAAAILAALIPPLLSPVCWNAVQLFNHSSETNQHLFGGRPRPGRCRPAANTPAAANLTPGCPDETRSPACQRHTSAGERIACSRTDSEGSSIQVLFKDLVSAVVVILERF